ncbi:MAG: transglutaminase domain-containing protein [Chloroflexota bacterium]|nr:transglutaminase domain-containing protein [Chloroflexota bacterium]
MTFHNLLGSILHRAITYALIVTMTGTSSIPIIRELPRATAAYLSMMERLGLLKSDPTSPLGVSPSVPEEMKNEMGGIMPTIGEDGEPVGFLLNADAFEMSEEDFAPSTVADPISVSRMQSTYAATNAVSNTLVITFTVTNNQLPAISIPELPATVTITDTIEAISAIDLSNDPNVIFNVLLADDLLPANATFVSADPMPDRSGDSMAWNLGDVPPLGSITATLTVQISDSVPDFIELDTGATAWGTLEGRMVSASTAPATLAPDVVGGTPVGDWLMWTLDADYYDEYMVQQAAELGNDWEQMFAYVRSLRYESYKGSLRGTRGTSWSEAGNSIDQASLLIAMLRGSGIPARYRHGTLSTERAQELILSMFPEPQGTIGHIPTGTEVADPANDPQLLEETIDHWWVQAYLPALGWTDLDPCFASAAPGQTFHDSLAADGTDQIAEVPDDLRHKVTMTVKVEQWDKLSDLAGGLDYSYPLSHTFNTVDLVGEPVTLGHLVNSDAPAAMIFGYVRHTYVPYFAVGDFEYMIEGESFQDLVSNFPFGNFITTAEWLLFDVRDADGNVEHYEREIVDRIGFENRQSGGMLDIGENVGLESIVTGVDLVTTVFAPHYVPLFALNRELNRQKLGTLIQEARTLQDEVLRMDPKDTSPEAVLRRRDLLSRLRPLLAQMAYSHILYFTHTSDIAQVERDRLSLTKSYFDSPRITIFSSEMSSEKAGIAFDLRKSNARILAFPGQSPWADYAARMARGFFESALEGVLLEKVGVDVTYVPELFQAAQQQGVDLVALGQDDLETLRGMIVSDEAKARLTTAVENGKIVIVPERPVQIGEQLLVGWYEVDPVSGEVIGVMETGLHGAILDYLTSFFFGLVIGGMVGGLVTAIAFIFTFSVKYVQFTLRNGHLPDLQQRRALLKEAAQVMSSTYLAGSYLLASVLNTVLLEATKNKVKLVGQKIINNITMLLVKYGPPAALGKFVVFFHPGAYTAGSFLGTWIGVFLAMAVVQRMADDPPLPPMLLGDTSPPPEENGGSVAKSQHTAKATFYPSSISNSLASPFIALTSTLQIRWSSTTQNTLESIAFSIPHASLYDPTGVPLGTGTIQATPRFSSAVALTQSSPLYVVLSGSGTASTYAPAVSGLGVGSNWLTYTAQLTSTQPYTLTLYDAIVTVDDTDVYTGDFTLVVTGTTTLEGSGHTAAPNFADSVSIRPPMRISPSAPSPSSPARSHSLIRRFAHSPSPATPAPSPSPSTPPRSTASN